MRKAFILIAVTTALLFFSSVKAEAQTAQLTNKFEVFLQQDNSFTVKQYLLVTNNQEKAVVSEVNVRIPYSFSDLRAYYNSEPISAYSQNNKVKVLFGDKYLKKGESAQIELNYNLGGLLQARDGLRTVYFPKFDNEVQKHKLIFYYPADWGVVSYYSEENVKISYNNGNYRVKFNTEKDALFVIGSFASARIKAEWDISSQSNKLQRVRIPIPSGPYLSFVYEASTENLKGLIDDAGNKYTFFELYYGQNVKGYYTGTVVFNENDIKPQKGNEGYLRNWKKIGVNVDSDSKQIYKDLLSLMEPSLADELLERNYISRSLSKEKKSSFEYANMLTALYRAKGLPSEVVYGLVFVPYKNEYTWHFWTIFKDDTGQSWKAVDPYLEDVTGFDFYERVNPQRIIWGVLDDKEDMSSIGINYILDINNSVRLLESSPVLGLNNNYDIQLEVSDTSYAGKDIPVSIIIRNLGSSEIYLDEVSFANVKLDSDKLKNYLFLPNSETTINVPGVMVLNPLKSGTEILEGELKLRIGQTEATYELQKEVLLQIDKRVLLINTVMIFVVVSSITICAVLIHKSRSENNYELV